MHTNIKKVIKIMEEIAPIKLAESWDNVGLLVGRENKMIENVLLALEVTEQVIDEAIDKNIDLIITHHPLIFKALNKINDKDPISKMVLRLIENGISLYSAHTNLDASELGTSSYLAELLGLSDTTLLKKHYQDDVYKLDVYVPEENADRLRTALTTAGLGKMGDYSDCTFSTKGLGTFKPGDSTNPYIGKIGQLETVEELKIEGILTKESMANVLQALHKNHPYEVPAYDLKKLENEFNPKGIGVVGFIDRMDLKSLNDQVKSKLDLKYTKVVGDLEKKISKVAIVTGAGADYITTASRKADVLITGDLKYHEAHYALQSNLMVIDAGHFETENIYMKRLKELLDLRFEEKSYDIIVHLSDVDINPFKLL